EDEYERPRPRQELEDAPEGPARLVGRGGRRHGAEHARDALDDRRTLRVAVEQPLERLADMAAEGLTEDLGRRRARDPLAVGEAATRERRCPVADRRGELPRKLGLADPGRAEHRD